VTAGLRDKVCRVHALLAAATRLPHTPLHCSRTPHVICIVHHTAACMRTGRGQVHQHPLAQSAALLSTAKQHEAEMHLLTNIHH
jgi:hypothetical protein